MDAVLAAKSKARLIYLTSSFKLPSNLTPPKDFWFVLALLKMSGQKYTVTFLDTPSMAKAWKWLVRWRKELGVILG